jgi:predicted Zn-dependent protease
LETLHTLKQRALRETIDPLAFAFLYAALGEKDAAFEWLRRASENVGVELLWARVDARYDPLRSDPRFGAFLKEIGLNP